MDIELQECCWIPDPVGNDKRKMNRYSLKYILLEKQKDFAWRIKISCGRGNAKKDVF